MVSGSPHASQPARFRHTRLFLGTSMLVMGTCGICYEYALGLMGNNLMGSSHEQLFVVIGIMMFAMGVGAMLQRQLQRDLLDWFLRFEVLLGLVGGFGALLTYVAFVYLTSYTLVLYGLAFSVGALIGLEIPLLIRINSAYSHSLRANLSNILAMDYVGSLAGALLFTYVLLSRVAVPSIGMFMGVANVALAAAGVVFFWPLVRRPGLVVAAVLFTAGALAVGLWRADDWTAALEQRCFEDPIIHSETTRYQHLVITKRADHTRLYINGHLQFDSLDEHIYHEHLVHVPMAVAPRQERVLILGGGDGLALREVLAYPQVREVTLVDIDPSMIALGSHHPELRRLNGHAFQNARVYATAATPREEGAATTVRRPSQLFSAYLNSEIYSLAEVEIFTVDADNFLRDVQQTYDVVLIDLPDPRSPELAKLYSVDFYRALRGRLRPHSVVSVQSTSPYRAREVFLCIGASLAAAGYQTLPYHDHLPSFGDWGWHLAWVGDTSAQQRREQLQDLQTLSVPTRYLTPDVVRAAFTFGKGVLQPPPDLRANTKLRPVITAYYARGFRHM